MATLSFKHVNKVYDDGFQAVYDFNLEVNDKEFVVFVGPSGCGKSTTLRMIAGLEEISSGEISINDKVINAVEPKDRGIAMVFQNYALYPHMSVRSNMAFALEMSGMKKEERNKLVEETAAVIGLTEYLDKKPGSLSGGQRQRVALGRAIVRKPQVFLMDEPLSNLDAKLRSSMRTEIIRIHKNVGATTIYVTHDQTEAMTMADKIVIMKDGFIQQVGSPMEIFNNPANIFVASFIGAPAMNLLKAKLSKKGLMLGDIKIPFPEDGMFERAMSDYQSLIEENKKDIEELKDLVSNEEAKASKKKKKGRTNRFSYASQLEKKTADLEKLEEAISKGEADVIIGVRPEDIYFKGDDTNANPSKPFEVETEITELLGREALIHASYLGEPITMRCSSRIVANPKAKIEVCFDLDRVHCFDSICEKSLLTK